MHVRPVRMERSHRPLTTPLLASDVGTLLSLLCFRRGVPMYYPRQARFRWHPDRFSKPGKTILIPIVFPSRGKRSSSRSFFQAGENDPHPDRFSKPGKTILDPSMRTVHTPPGLAVDRPGDEKGTSQIHVETLYERPLQRLQQPAGTVYLTKDKARFFGALVFCGINRASP